MAAEGSDFSGIDDIDPALRAVSGRRALAEAVARRLTTPLGSMPDWPSYGFDLRSVIGTSLTDSVIRQRVRAQALAEEEIQDCRVALSRSADAIAITLTLIDADGPFDFTVDVSDLDVTAIIPV